MKTLLRWLMLALAAAVVFACQVDRLLRNGTGGGNGPPPDTSAVRVTFSTQPNNATAGQVIVPPVTVVVTDSAGNPVTSYSGSVTVSLGANATGATLSGANTATAVNGVATFSGLSVDKVGSGYTLNAVSSGLSGATSTPFSVSSRPAPPPTQVAFIGQPSNTQSGDPIAPAIQVAAEDSTGNVVTTYTGAIAIAIGANPSGGTLSGTAVASAANGIASFSSLSIDKAGTGYTLTASASGLAGATSGAFTITAPPPPPPMATALEFTAQPQSAQTGASLGTITVAAVDSTGTTVTDFSGTVTLAIGANAGGGTLSGTVSAGISNGVATFSGLSIDQAGTGYTLTASTNGLASATSSAFNVTAPATNQPPVVNAGGNQQQLVSVLYQLNASFTDADNDGPWTYDVNWGDGTSTSGTLSAQGGIGPSHTYVLPGTYTITVTVTDSRGASGTGSKTLSVTT